MSGSLFSTSLMMNSCFPQAGMHPFRRQLASFSAPCFQSSSTGKARYDQQRKGTKTRKEKEVLGDARRYLVSSDTSWRCAAMQFLPCEAALLSRIMLGAYFQVCFQFYMPLTLVHLETSRALYVFQLKQAEKEDKLTFKYYFN